MNPRPFHVIRWFCAQVFIGVLALSGVLAVVSFPFFGLWWLP